MPILNRIRQLHDEITLWRRQIHSQPELLYDVTLTAAFVATKLTEFGVDEVATGIGRTGVVGIIHGEKGVGEKGGGSTIGLRADMDALPITETTAKPWASTIAGKMHACGHDGHTAMLLGAACYLAETRNFIGSVAVIFQPAEEGGAGAQAMVQDGMMERFSIREVYGMHNLPGLDVGKFSTCKGPIMASTDEFNITVRGRGGHAAMPHTTIDPVLTVAQIITNLQSIVSRNIDPLHSVVVSVTKLRAGQASNVIPDEASFGGTVRTLMPQMRVYAQRRVGEIATSIAKAHECTVDISYRIGYPVTVNHDGQTDVAIRIAGDIAGAGLVNPDTSPVMGAEDFSYMLEARPGSFIFIGNGDSAGLHNANYDFNDEIIPIGVSYWVKLAESRLAELA